MTAQETNVTNGAETTLSSALSAGATTINVTSSSSFPAVPFYAVIDPDVDASREVILVDDSTTATTFVLSSASKRGLDGTTDTSHSLGAKVVCVPIAALWTDINDRVDAVSATASAAYTPGGTDVAVADGGTGASTAADARTNLGLGTIATQAASNVAITGGSVTDITDLAVADGGTGASTAAGARTNLGAEIIGGTSRAFTAGDLESVRGTPALGNPNVTWAYWLLDSASQEAVGASLHVPEGWSTIDIDIWWVNAGAGAGDVVLGYRRDSPGEGGTLGTGAASGSSTITAAAQNVLKKTTIALGVTVSALSIVGIAVERNGGAAADTLGNDIGVLAVVIRKAS